MDVKNVNFSDRWGESRYSYSKPYMPELKLDYYVGVGKEKVDIHILDESGTILKTLTGDGNIGFHQATWNLKPDLDSKKKKRPLTVSKNGFLNKGKYKIEFIAGNEKDVVEFEVK